MDPVSPPSAPMQTHRDTGPVTPTWRSVTIGWAAAEPPEAVVAALDGDPVVGLSDEEAGRRLAEVGPNALRTHHAGALSVLVRQLRSPLLVLLAVTAGVSSFFGEGTDAIIIGVILIVSVGLGFANEYRAERTAEALHSEIRHRVVVRREGRLRSRDVTELVPGDLVELHQGELVPADIRLLEVRGLACDESVLTGESLPVEKSVDAVAAGTPLADLSSCALMGTVVQQGTALGVVVATGGAAAFGRIALALGERHPETEFQHGLRQFSGMLVRVALMLMLAIVVINVVLRRPLIDALLFALAIAVGITPQLLPAVVTTSLAAGSRQLAQRKVLVKRLVCIEDLGNVDVLFTDKTGTLTEGDISFDRAVPVEAFSATELIELGLLCTEVTVADGRAVSGNALDVALWNGVGSGPPVVRRVAILPFDHERRLVSVLVDHPGRGRVVITKGAPETVLERCRNVSDLARASLEDLFAAGRRVVAVACRAAPHPGRNSIDPADEHDLTLIGYLAFYDRPKQSARAALSRLAELGVSVRILTGDNPVVASTVCAELGLSVQGVLTGTDLDQLDDDGLGRALVTTTVFARVSPEQKARVIAAQRRAGSDVAFLGDGVNDAIALHKADVGISVDSATDVAKDAADVVLLEKDLNVVADGVAEGRRIFANTIKYVLMGTSSNFGNMVSAVVASAFLPFLPMLPPQILLNNLLYDTSQLAIPTDRVDPEAVTRPAHWDIAFIRRFMIFFGPISSLFDFVTFGIMLWGFDAGEALFQSGWFIESLATQTLVIFVIRTRRVPFLRSGPSFVLATAALSVVLVGAIIPLSPLADLLGFSAPPVGYYVLLIGLVAGYLTLAEIGKAWFLRDRGAAQERVSRAREAWRRQRHAPARAHHRRVHRRAARWTHRGPVPAARP
ncbi:MAG: magnesium-translocating P-type ATPase [Acidimicrobiales bacterium]|nr:magnesium-translocating P-type ATPase [Acidimicrobiales bacterium]